MTGGWVPGQVQTKRARKAMTGSDADARGKARADAPMQVGRRARVVAGTCIAPSLSLAGAG